MWPFRTKPRQMDPFLVALSAERDRLKDALDAATARGNAEAVEAINRGAEVMRLTADKMALAEQLAKAVTRAEEAEYHVEGLSYDLEAGRAKRDELQSRLDRIAAKGEASRNGTARLMAKIARGEA